MEITLEALPEAVMPDLSGLPGVAGVDLLGESALKSVYLDTLDLRLARSGVTLCRRTGSAAPGWRLEFPDPADARTQMLVPIGRDEQAPLELVAAVRARVRDEPFAPVVVLRTQRTVRLLRDASGRVLAEVADDTVTSRSLGGAEVATGVWRAWVVQLIDGDRRLLSSAHKVLRAGGGATPGWPSAMALALGDRPDSAGLEGVSARAAVGSAGTVLGEHLRARREVLLMCDPLVRQNVPDGVHQMRVATRELRSALATFRVLVVRERSEAVRVELGWLGALLGVARDAEVGRDRLAELVAGESADLVTAPVGEQLDADRAGANRIALERVREALDSPRYFRLLDALDALVDDPPLTKAATGPAGKVMPVLVRRDWQRLDRAFAAARQAPPGPRRDVLLHAVRKAAKRARYSAEAVIPVVGHRAESFARAAKELQTLLGYHHDSVELRALLRRVATQAYLEGQDTFSYGRLHAIEQARAEQIEDRLPSAWDRVAARRRRRWMR
jgi:CHAD domain-containing protein